MIEVQKLQIPDDLVPENSGDLFRLNPDADSYDEPEKEEVESEETAEQGELTEETAEEVEEQEESEELEEDEEDNSEIAIIGTDITEKQLAKYKAKYNKLFRSYLNNDIYVWHRLSRAEFADVMKQTSDITDLEEKILKREELVCKAACVYPSLERQQEIFKDNEIFASNMCEEILSYSGFVKALTSQV
jgi:hypothetical protein